MADWHILQLTVSEKKKYIFCTSYSKHCCPKRSSLLCPSTRAYA